MTYEETAKRFGISIRTLFRWKSKPELEKRRNKPATKLNMEALKKNLEENSDLYLSERAAEYNVSMSGIDYAIKRLNITYKRNANSSKIRLQKRRSLQKEN